MKFFLRILSWLYAFGVWIRNSLYDSGLQHVLKSPLPTICVGNLAVGGTGKTPHVEYIGQLLEANGYQFAILSRGYKRKSVGFVLASDKSTVNTIGDESLQLKMKHPNWIVAVCKERIIGLYELRRHFPKLDCVILDDAFQYRRINPGYSMILTQADRLYVEDQLLPLGRLREPVIGCLRAQMVVVTKCPEHMQPIDQRLVDSKLKLLPSKTLVFSRMEYQPLAPVFPDSSPNVGVKLQSTPPLADKGGCASKPTNRQACIEDLSQVPAGQRGIKPGQRVLLLTGIAQPHYLYDHLRQEAAELTHLTFPDHHAFTERDMQQLEELFSQKHCTLIVTTEKDAVRLRHTKYFPTNLKPLIYAMPIEVKFLNDGQHIFDNNILNYVRQSTKDR